MNILIIGGTGFLGYYAALEMLKRGHTVTALGLPPLPREGLFPADVKIVLADLNRMSDEEIKNLLHGQDALVFAAGVDDRVTPRKPAYPFFHLHNVESVTRLFSLAREAGVKRGVVLGSYFAHFDRIWPHMSLAVHHPYIRSRVEQESAAIAAGWDSMAVMILELPYIFGVMPGRMPLWKPLISYIRSGMPLLYPRGGTTCVSVQQVAEAITGAVEAGVGGERYPVGGVNLTWRELLHKLGHFSGVEKKVITLPDWVVRTGAFLLKTWHAVKGFESGLDPVKFIELQTAETFIDPLPTQKALGISSQNLDEALRETVLACIEESGN